MGLQSAMCSETASRRNRSRINSVTQGPTLSLLREARSAELTKCEYCYQGCVGSDDNPNPTPSSLRPAFISHVCDWIVRAVPPLILLSSGDGQPLTLVFARILARRQNAPLHLYPPLQRTQTQLSLLYVL